MEDYKKTAEKIIDNYVLNYDRIETDENYISVRFYYEVENEKFYLWIDWNKEECTWDFNNYIFYISASKDMLLKALQENIKLTEKIDEIMCCNIIK